MTEGPIFPGFKIRDFPSPRMTAGNAIELILQRALVLRRQIYPPFSFFSWFETVPPREGQELDLITGGYMLRITLWNIF